MWLVPVVLLIYTISTARLEDAGPGSKESLFQENFGTRANISSLCMRFPGQNVTGRKKKYIFSKSKVTWHRARDLCETFGQEFASITSQEEMQQFIDTYRVQGIRAPYIWIGGSDFAIPKTFVWTTFPPTPFFYTNWRSGEPNTMEHEHCVHVYSDFWENDQYWTWNDDMCHHLREFTCQTYD